MSDHIAPDHVLERHWKKWLSLTQHVWGQEDIVKPLPTVTISRERGSGGSLIAEQVAKRLGFVLFDSEIVSEVARSASVDRLVLMHLDERSRASIQEWTDRVARRENFSMETYMSYLTKTILAIGEKGLAVIIGRGAHLIIPVERCFRVRVIAPFEVRVQRVATNEDRSLLEAETIVSETDRQRSQFIQENFRQSDANPLLYDLVMNTAEIAVDTAADLVARAVEAKFPQVLQIQQLHQHAIFTEEEMESGISRGGQVGEVAG